MQGSSHAFRRGVGYVPELPAQLKVAELPSIRLGEAHLAHSHYGIMAYDFETRLIAQVDFPSPSRVASEVIALARDPNIEIAKVAQAVSRDPAMTAKLLRIANSAFYAQRRPSQNIRQAFVIIGLNAALTLALSFSLVSTLRACKPNGIDYRRFWRRTLLAATASRAFGEIACKGQDEDLFLAGLLQDVAILAIDRAVSGFYSKLPQGATHTQQIAYEKERIEGKDHATYGAQLLKSWNLPEKLWQAVASSHSPEHIDSRSDAGRFARCVALGSELAEATLAADRPAALLAVATLARNTLALKDEQFARVVTRVLNLIPETEELYETSIIEPEDAEALLAQAREMLTVHSLHTLQEVHALQETANVLLSRTEELEDASRRDSLTGMLNRTWTDRQLEREFTQAVMFGRPFTIAFADIDHFKSLNERYGHRVGDRVLRACAQSLQANIRGSDLIGRYGGEEFLILLPGTDKEVARKICWRLLAAMREIKYDANGTAVTTTISIGAATLTQQHRFATASDMVEAADHALYAAKLRGRNCVECFEDLNASSRRNLRSDSESNQS
jgi:diguanylate cyclase (GGDEF)-like protein